MKKLIIFLSLILFSSGVFGQITGKSKSGRLFMKKETEKNIEFSSPTINLLSPKINDKNQLTVEDNFILVEGNIDDEYGLKELKINHTIYNVNNKSEFSEKISLNPGLNNVVIRTVNTKDKVSALSFSVLVNIKIDLPEIVITEPIIDSFGEVRHHESIITVRGRVIDQHDIKEIKVNDISATIMQGREFFANVKLKDGVNNIFVKTINVNDIADEKSFKVVTPIDVDGPKITLIEPAPVRGVQVVSKKDVIKILGNVSDPSGVSEVRVNNRRAKVLANNDFTIDMFLAMGDNRIVVQAVDNKFNTSADTFFVKRTLDEIIKSGRYIALLIGINEYEGYWNPLKNAVNDASELAEVLKNHYNFDEVYTLLDKSATRRNIIQKLEWLTSNIKNDDNVLIFYAGHGQFNKSLNKGYWVPADAKTKSVADYISNNDVKTFIGGIPSKHTLLITDACFAGDIFRGSGSESIQFDPNDMSKYYREVYRKPSRVALTSGSIEPVMDSGKDNHSIFTYYLLKALKENKRKYLDASQLFNEFRMAVANNSEQTPQLQAVRDTDDEGGQFIFIRKDIE